MSELPFIEQHADLIQWVRETDNRVVARKIVDMEEIIEELYNEHEELLDDEIIERIENILGVGE